MIYGVGNLTERIESLLAQFDLLQFRHTKCGVLSSGEQTRVSLAKAMLNRPTLLLLDEPTASLDPSVAHDVRTKIREATLQGDSGVLWTSHNMHEVEEVCDRVLFLSHGKILLEGDPRKLPAEHGKETLEELFIAVAREPLTAGRRMNPRRTAAIVLRQFYLLRGSPARILPMFAWVAIDIMLWGFFTRYLNSVASAGFNFIPAVLGALAAVGLPGARHAGRDDRVLRRRVVAELPEHLRHAALAYRSTSTGLVVSSMATSAVGLTVMLALATTVFGLSFFVYGLLLVPFLLVLFLFGVALGIFGCAVVLRMGPAAEWLIWPVPAMLSPLACVFYPISALPHWLQYPARLLPPSYVFEAMRAMVSGRAVSASALTLSAGLALFYILLAGWFFTRIYNYVVRSGLVARYSAESVS